MILRRTTLRHGTRLIGHPTPNLQNRAAMTSCCSPGGSDLQVHLQRPDRVSPPLFEVLSHDLKQSMLKDICVPVAGGAFMVGDDRRRGYSADGATPVHRDTLAVLSLSPI